MSSAPVDLAGLVSQSRVLLFDVEGTTTPIDFVTKELFPFARVRMESFLAENAKELAADLEALKREFLGEPLAPFAEYAPLPYLLWLMDRDRKSPALKSIQGKIWEGGYRSGALKGAVYPEVRSAFERWKDEGKRLFIYSSGSVLAQKLLFGYSSAGDMLPLLEGHFDTGVGAKREAGSYREIARRVGTEEKGITFFSDIVAELDAAREAGMGTVLVCRSGKVENNGHPWVSDFQ